MACRLIFVRHGQSLGNKVRSFLGHTNLDLSELGYMQAEITGKYLSKRNIDVIYSSDLIRAYHTSLPLAKYKNIVPEKRENLREIFAGEWENQLFDDLVENRKDTYGVWKENIGFAVPDGGESVWDLRNRIIKEVTSIAEENDGKTVAIFTHATPIRTFFSFVRGLSREEIKDIPWASNASVSEALFENGKFSEISYSIDDFLGEIGSTFPKNV
jgi:broad specificity phosphatase PhoE